MGKEKNRVRKTVRALEDLLPEVLIEAQGCDRVTALAALRRAYESLCQSYNFDERTFWVRVSEADRRTDGSAAVRLGRQNLIQVSSVCTKDPYGGFFAVAFSLDGDLLVIPESELPEELERNGHAFGLRVTASFMPDVDGNVEDSAELTKWRLLVVAKALEDLLSMESQPWTSAARYQIYRERTERFIEDYLIAEKFHAGIEAPPRATVPPSMNVFC